MAGRKRASKDSSKHDSLPLEGLEDEESVGAEAAEGTEVGYKDELNLAEFPIAALADRVPDGQLSLVFEDRLDQKNGPPIVRRLTITGTHKHGLPTALDDEVMVGLIQLTKRRNNFTDQRVSFSRYELIDLLGWPQSGQSYQRIEEALNRWVGVVLMYENAWWDNAAKSWVDENFHVLDNVTLYDRERRRGARGAGKRTSGKRPAAEGEPPALSSFRWNEVIFRSFQSGNLKQLDLDFYLKLRLPTTKRLFRFLDKRFYRRDRLEFDLRTLACEHVGLSRTYAPTELKRRLKPALEELEKLGFLEPLAAAERYVWVARGAWRVLLIRGPHGRSEATEADEENELIDALVERGVSSKTAADLVSLKPHSRVRAKIEVFDWLVRNQDKRIGKNASGYLVASIRDDYQAPDDYQPPAEADRLAEVERLAAEAERRRRDRERQEAEAAAAREAELKAQWDALPSSSREAITARVKAENPGLRRWKTMLEPLCLAELGRLIESGEPIPSAPSQNTLFPDAGAL
jgi:hypothetical protein